MTMQQLLDDATADDPEPLIHQRDQLYDALLLLLPIVALVAVITFALLTR